MQDQAVMAYSKKEEVFERKKAIFHSYVRLILIIKNNTLVFFFQIFLHRKMNVRKGGIGVATNYFLDGFTEAALQRYSYKKGSENMQQKITAMPKCDLNKVA